MARSLRATCAFIAPCTNPPAYRGAVLASARLRASALVALFVRSFAPFLRQCALIAPCADHLPTHLALAPLPPELDEAHPPAFLSLTVLISRRASQALWAGRQRRKTRPGCLVYPFAAGVLEYGTVHAVGRQTRQGYLIHPLQPVRTNISPTQCSSTHSRTRARARARRKPTPPPHIQAHPPAIPKSHPTHHHHNPPTHPPTHPPTTRAAGVFHCSNSCRRHLHRRGPGKLHAGPRGCGW